MSSVLRTGKNTASETFLWKIFSRNCRNTSPSKKASNRTIFIHELGTTYP